MWNKQTNKKGHKWNRQALRSNQANGMSSESSSVSKETKASGRLIKSTVTSRKTLVTCNYSYPSTIVTDSGVKEATKKSYEIKLTPCNSDTSDNNNQVTSDEKLSKVTDNEQLTYYFTSEVWTHIPEWREGERWDILFVHVCMQQERERKDEMSQVIARLNKLYTQVTWICEWIKW